MIGVQRWLWCELKRLEKCPRGLWLVGSDAISDSGLEPLVVWESYGDKK